MSTVLEDYALLSDCRRAALVDRGGSIDWMCLPRFDSPACFAALLGTPEHGRWRVGPGAGFRSERCYRGDSLVLETDFLTATGRVRLVDALIVGEEWPLLIRQVIGIEGKVDMVCDVALRFDYGSIEPWLRHTAYGLSAVAGPDEVHIQSPFTFDFRSDLTAHCEFSIAGGETHCFSLAWSPYFKSSYQPIEDFGTRLAATHKFWTDYASQCTYAGRYREAVVRSVLTLKALTYQPTGGIVAAPTTSLPETLGGERNWDYRFSWIRDSTFSMYALLTAGYHAEAQKWQEWLLRALAGTPSQVNILYGVAGERRLHELTLPWLPGYEASLPVRTGNAAYTQLQLDVFGEALDTFHLAVKSGLPLDEEDWRVLECFISFLAENWDQPDEGIWEVRGPRQHFTHSKVMAWVAVDRAIRTARLANVEAPLEQWSALRDAIHADVCARGFNADIGSFTQYYGSANVDASLLMIPIVGFLKPDDPRILTTVARIERQLFKDGFVLRYRTQETPDALRGREGSFLACSFWLVDCWILMGRVNEAEQLFRRLLGLANDLGLLSEEYDSEARRLVGNFPQALSHIALINSAFNLSNTRGPARDRSEGAGT